MTATYQHEPKLSPSLRAACGQAYRPTSGSVLYCADRQRDALVKRGLAYMLSEHIYLLTAAGERVGREWEMKMLHGPDWAEATP